MHHLKKKNSNTSSQRGPAKMFGGPARIFPPASQWLSTSLLLLHAKNITQRPTHHGKKLTIQSGIVIMSYHDLQVSCNRLLVARQCTKSPSAAQYTNC